MKYRFIGKDKHGNPAYNGNMAGWIGEIVEIIDADNVGVTDPRKSSAIGIIWQVDDPIKPSGKGDKYLVHRDDIEEVK